MRSHWSPVKGELESAIEIVDEAVESLMTGPMPGKRW